LKKFISLLAAIGIFFLGAQGLAVEKSDISFETARDILLKNNKTLQKMDYTIQQAKDSYEDTLKESKKINPEGIYIRVGGKTILFSFPIEVEAALTKQRDVLPEQMKHYWFMAEQSKIVTTNKLVSSLRDLYAGVYAANAELDNNKRKSDILQQSYKQNKARFQQGLITEMELEESGYDMTAALKNVTVAKRNLDNMIRSLNVLMGVPMNRTYSGIIFKESGKAGQLKGVQYYVDKAKEERLEIIDLKKQIQLKEMELSIIERYLNLSEIEALREDHDKVSGELESLKIKLELEKLKIEKEIRDAYFDIANTGKNVKNMEESLRLQRDSLEKLKVRYRLGYITKDAVNRLEAVVNELEAGYNISLYNYNTKLIKLENSAGIGPAYEEGAAR
jgi:uncharacterized protein (UPF0335 family)